jgi:hypothetical protein
VITSTSSRLTSGRLAGRKWADRPFVEFVGAERKDHGWPESRQIGGCKERREGNGLASAASRRKRLAAEAGSAAEPGAELATELCAGQTGQLASPIKRPICGHGVDHNVQDSELTAQNFVHAWSRTRLTLRKATRRSGQVSPTLLPCSRTKPYRSGC